MPSTRDILYIKTQIRNNVMEEKLCKQPAHESCYGYISLWTKDFADIEKKDVSLW